MSSFWQFFDSRMSILRKVSYRHNLAHLVQTAFLTVQQSLQVLPHFHLFHVRFMVLSHHFLPLSQSPAEVLLFLDLLRIILPVYNVNIVHVISLPRNKLPINNCYLFKYILSGLWSGFHPQFS